MENNSGTAEAFTAKFDPANVKEDLLKKLYEQAAISGNLEIAASLETALKPDDQAAALCKASPNSKRERLLLRGKVLDLLDRAVVSQDTLLELFKKVFIFKHLESDEFDQIWDVSRKLKENGLVLTAENFNRVHWANETTDFMQVVKFLKDDLHLSKAHLLEIVVRSADGQELMSAVEALKLLDLTADDLNLNDTKYLKKLSCFDFLSCSDVKSKQSLAEYLRGIPDLHWSQVFLDADCTQMIPFIILTEAMLDDPAAQDSEGEGLLEKISDLPTQKDRIAFAKYCEQHGVPGTEKALRKLVHLRTRYRLSESDIVELISLPLQTSEGKRVAAAKKNLLEYDQNRIPKLPWKRAVYCVVNGIGVVDDRFKAAFKHFEEDINKDFKDAGLPEPF
jgi:hypothetical protein